LIVAPDIGGGEQAEGVSVQGRKAEGEENGQEPAQLEARFFGFQDLAPADDGDGLRFQVPQEQVKDEVNFHFAFRVVG
jgi:hypothetical protein